MKNLELGEKARGGEALRLHDRPGIPVLPDTLRRLLVGALHLEAHLDRARFASVDREGQSLNLQSVNFIMMVLL
jgi:hypothetical protein